MYTSILKRLMLPTFLLLLPMLALSPQLRHTLDGLQSGGWEVHP